VREGYLGVKEIPDAPTPVAKAFGVVPDRRHLELVHCGLAEHGGPGVSQRRHDR
jgi:hypothetical protein